MYLKSPRAPEAGEWPLFFLMAAVILVIVAVLQFVLRKIINHYANNRMAARNAGTSEDDLQPPNVV